MHHQRQKAWQKPEPSRYEVPPEVKFKLPWVSLMGEFGSLEDDEAVMLECERLLGEFVLEKPDVAAARPEVVARRSDTGEVLFHFREPREIREGGFVFAVVNLSWSGKAEPYPEMARRITYFEDWADWEYEGMDRDAQEFSRRSAGDA